MDNTILLVDDDEDFLDALATRLTNDGYKVLKAADGEKGLRAFQEHRPAIVLADIKMPGMDGIDLLRKIKDIDPQAEVIMITGHADMDLAVKSLKHRATDFITKPILDDVLKVALQRTIERIDLNRQVKEYTLNKAMYQVVINDLIQEDIMVIGANYQILEVNETLLKRLGLEREEVVGHHCFEVSHHLHSPCKGRDHPCPLMESLQTGKPSQATHVHRDKAGRELFYSISCYPIFEQGQIAGVVEISKDISKDIEFQKRMMGQQKLASIGQLAAGVAHEINNPLTTILTTAMVAQEDMRPEDPHYEEFQTIANETLRCRKIVTGLLDFARQSPPARKSNDINAIVRECIALVTKPAAFRDVAVESRLFDKLPTLVVDHDQILQSLINLVLNAIEASDPGGKISLSTSYLPEKAALEVKVQDTGKGIPQDALDNIFDPFFTTKDTGTGLGLAITHGFVHQNGGTIEVESREGVGTTFTIRLPLAGQENAVDQSKEGVRR
jgi:two-component system NtrC family sensor kinase